MENYAEQRSQLSLLKHVSHHIYVKTSRIGWLKGRDWEINFDSLLNEIIFQEAKLSTSTEEGLWSCWNIQFRETFNLIKAAKKFLRIRKGLEESCTFLISERSAPRNNDDC